MPPAGSNTQFLNMCRASEMYRACETLPAALRTAIEGRAMHHQTVYDGRGDVRMGMTVSDIDDVRLRPGDDRPIVRTHGESARQYLFLGRNRLASIVGMDLDEGRAIVEVLCQHAADPDFVWTQIWAADDLVARDNRCTMHRRDAFDPATVRLMHRTTAQGERLI